MRSSPIQTNFTTGRLSRKMGARSDVSKYNNGCFELDNFVVMPQGGISRRPGFRHVFATKNAVATKLIPFKFSTTQSYIIEAGEQYFRFYKDHGIIVSAPSTPVELATVYTLAQVHELTWTQSLDTLFLFHPNVRPKTLTRTSHTSWTITDFDFQDGPYLDANITTTTLTAAATSGNTTITASSTTGINNNQGFLTTDVGRHIRLRHGSSAYTFGWAVITARNSSTQVAVTVKSNFGATTATDYWQLGCWSDTTGWPACGEFYENRMWFGGVPIEPQTLYASMSGGLYNQFSQSKIDGTVTAEYGLRYKIGSNDVNPIRRLSAGKTLTALTASAEFSISASALNEAITPTNIKIVKESTRGAAAVRIVRIDSAILFWQRLARKLREYVYVFQNDSYSLPDLTVMAEDISYPGIKDMDYQQDPYSIVWSVTDDGVLIGTTYIREQEVVGFHRHPLSGTDAKVSSIAVIPEPNGRYDELWISTTRTINGATYSCVEYMTPFAEPKDENDKDWVFLDCSAEYSGSPTNTISGLTWLVGQTVGILADQSIEPDAVVSPAGTITLRTAASKVQVGLKYKSVLESVRWEGGGNYGTAQGKIGRIHKLTMRLHNTLGLKYGPDKDHLETVYSRKASDLMDSSPPLFSGDKIVAFPSDYGTDRQVYAETDWPYPATILGLMPDMVVYE